MSGTKIDAKIVLLGDAEVGKTCLVTRFVDGVFDSETSRTFGGAFSAKSVFTQKDEYITLGIWDTAGQERFKAMSRIYYRGAHVALIVYDLSKPETFKRVTYWADELRLNQPSAKIYIVGAKADLVDPEKAPEHMEEAKEYAKGLAAKHSITSALAGTGIDEVFTTVANDFVERREDEQVKEQAKLNMHANRQTRGGGCCKS